MRPGSARPGSARRPVAPASSSPPPDSVTITRLFTAVPDSARKRSVLPGRTTATSSSSAVQQSHFGTPEAPNIRRGRVMARSATTDNVSREPGGHRASLMSTHPPRPASNGPATATGAALTPHKSTPSRTAGSASPRARARSPSPNRGMTGVSASPFEALTTAVAAHFKVMKILAEEKQLASQVVQMIEGTANTMDSSFVARKFDPSFCTSLGLRRLAVIVRRGALRTVVWRWKVSTLEARMQEELLIRRYQALHIIGRSLMVKAHKHRYALTRAWDTWCMFVQEVQDAEVRRVQKEIQRKFNLEMRAKRRAEARERARRRNAAVKIQREYRQYRLRTKARRDRQRRIAALKKLQHEREQRRIKLEEARKQAAYRLYFKETLVPAMARLYPRAVKKRRAAQKIQRAMRWRVWFVNIQAMKIQRVWRCHHHWKELGRARRAATRIAAAWRGWAAWDAYHKYASARTCQALIRRYILRMRYLKYRGARALQAAGRRKIQRMWYIRYWAATRIARMILAWLNRNRLRKRRAATKLQTHWRGVLARRVLKKMIANASAQWRRQRLERQCAFLLTKIGRVWACRIRYLRNVALHRVKLAAMKQERRAKKEKLMENRLFLKSLKLDGEWHIISLWHVRLGTVRIDAYNVNTTKVLSLTLSESEILRVLDVVYEARQELRYVTSRASFLAICRYLRLRMVGGRMILSIQYPSQMGERTFVVAKVLNDQTRAVLSVWERDPHQVRFQVYDIVSKRCWDWLPRLFELELVVTDLGFLWRRPETTLDHMAVMDQIQKMKAARNWPSVRSHLVKSLWVDSRTPDGSPVFTVYQQHVRHEAACCVSRAVRRASAKNLALVIVRKRARESLEKFFSRDHCQYYYINRFNGYAQWSKPWTLGDVELVAEDAWRPYVDSNGRSCFFNPSTGQVSQYSLTEAAKQIQAFIRRCQKKPTTLTMSELLKAARFEARVVSTFKADPDVLSNRVNYTLWQHAVLLNRAEAKEIYLTLPLRHPVELVGFAIFILGECTEPRQLWWTQAQRMLAAARRMDAKLSQFKIAERCFFTYAANFRPKSAEVWCNLALVKQCVNAQYGLAEKYYRRALKIDPTNMMVRYNFIDFLKNRVATGLYPMSAGPDRAAQARAKPAFMHDAGLGMVRSPATYRNKPLSRWDPRDLDKNPQARSIMGDMWILMRDPSKARTDAKAYFWKHNKTQLCVWQVPELIVEETMSWIHQVTGTKDLLPQPEDVEEELPESPYGKEWLMSSHYLGREALAAIAEHEGGDDE